MSIEIPEAAQFPGASPSPLDVAKIREDFPILEERVNGYPIAYLDNAATSQKPRTVLDVLRNYYEHRNANVHRGMHKLSRRATDSYEGARSKVAKWIGATSSSEVIWTRGTTEAINLVAASWGGENLSNGDVILLSDMEHHSNIVPWQLVAARTGAELRYIELDDEGRLQLDELPRLLADGRVKIAAVTHVSNALGTINPIAEIARQVHEAGALLLVDGAQGAAHHPADVKELGADFYAFSGHKMCGPTGIGVLWGKEKLLEAMPPYQGGGEMISLVERDFSTWAALPHKFEAGTPHIAGAAALSAAIDYLDGVGADRILAHERDLVGYALEKLSHAPGIRLLGPKSLEERAGVVSFTLEYAHPHDISTVLDSLGIAIRAGHHCAQLVMHHFGVPATARASFYFYNTRAEVDRLVDGLDEVRSIFGDF
jgi:cysteine desulfurase/selenocysteine lyase